METYRERAEIVKRMHGSTVHETCSMFAAERTEKESKPSKTMAAFLASRLEEG